MKPSFTYSILSHAWRAHSLLNLLTKPQAFEVFPASWFLLCEFDDTVVWKGEDTARQRKVDWFRKQISKLASERICTINYNDQWASADDADALACILCSVLLAERATLQRLDVTVPPVLFPPRVLWDDNLPETVRKLPWQDYSIE